MTGRMKVISDVTSLFARTRGSYIICLSLMLQFAASESGYSPRHGPAPEGPPQHYEQPGGYYHQQEPMVKGGPVAASSLPSGYPPGQMIQSAKIPDPRSYPDQTPAYPMQPPPYPEQNTNYGMQPRDDAMQYRDYPGQQQSPRGSPSSSMMHGPGPVRPRGPIPIPSSGKQPSSVPPPLSSMMMGKLKSNKCGALGKSEFHGYQLREYKVVTKDHYELTLHRLIHPSDVKQLIKDNLDSNGQPPDERKLRRLEPKMKYKKPYILLHGLVGSSASFLRNIQETYKAPEEFYDSYEDIKNILNDNAKKVEHDWQSTADRLNEAYFGDTSNKMESAGIRQKLTNSFKRRTFVSSQLIDTQGDKLNFAYHFTQAHRKFWLPKESLKGGKYISNSLAFTMSNFGYDVWLINLRGNEYSRKYDGPLNSEQPEYWNFNLENLINQDLLASINQVKEARGWKSLEGKEIGVVTYSYGSLPILGLLNAHIQYQQILQPVIMMAPTLLTSSSQETGWKHLIKLATKALISHTGPFPNRAKGFSLEHIICKLPFASKLCNLMTIILQGRPKSVKNIILDEDAKALMLKDSECGQTSTGVLHQIVRNLSQNTILSTYTPWVKAKEKLERGDLRRTIMIIRSQSDEISTPTEVESIKDSSIKGMVLSDVVIQEPNFGHTDYLFSKKNQYLVNAEVVRMALVFDYVNHQEWANKKVDPSRG